MNFEELSQELQEKIKACKSAEEMASLCADQGVELSDDEITAIAGGIFRPDGCNMLVPDRSSLVDVRVPNPCRMDRDCSTVLI